MTAPAGTRRQAKAPAAAAVVGELRRLRAQLAGVLDELAAVTGERDQIRALYLASPPVVRLDVDEPGPAVPLAVAKAWAQRAYDYGYSHGRDASPPVVLLDVDPPGDFPNRIDRRRIAELDRLRYPPHGRKRFGEPRPGEYAGGPVEWEPGSGGGAAS